jgi:NADPH:quinone reductase-like Zn-dependent oxidoreductase
MKAAFIEEHGGPEVLQIGHRPEPKPAGGEVVVRVSACGLNHLDLWVRMGGKRPFPLPLIPGTDVAGVREDTGQEVVVFPGVWSGAAPAGGGSVALAEGFGILGATRDGGMAERVAVPARNCLPKPPGLSFVQAAAVPVVFVTAWHMLMARAAVRAGEWVLIHAAGSGVSHAGIQIAKQAGAKVIASSSTPEKLTRAAALGADELVDYKREDVAARVRQITGGRGVGVAFDHVGAATWAASIASLARGGRLVFCGTTAGPQVSLDLGPLYYQCQSILGSTLGTPQELAEVLRLLAEGTFQVVIDRTFPLARLTEAHRYLASQRQFGKVVIEIA